MSQPGAHYRHPINYKTGSRGLSQSTAGITSRRPGGRSKEESSFGRREEPKFVSRLRSTAVAPMAACCYCFWRVFKCASLLFLATCRTCFKTGPEALISPSEAHSEAPTLVLPSASSAAYSGKLGETIDFRRRVGRLPVPAMAARAGGKSPDCSLQRVAAWRATSSRVQSGPRPRINRPRESYEPRSRGRRDNGAAAATYFG